MDVGKVLAGWGLLLVWRAFAISAPVLSRYSSRWCGSEYFEDGWHQKQLESHICSRSRLLQKTNLLLQQNKTKAPFKTKPLWNSNQDGVLMDKTFVEQKTKCETWNTKFLSTWSPPEPRTTVTSEARFVTNAGPENLLGDTYDVVSDSVHKARPLC